MHFNIQLSGWQNNVWGRGALNKAEWLYICADNDVDYVDDAVHIYVLSMCCVCTWTENLGGKWENLQEKPNFVFGMVVIKESYTQTFKLKYSKKYILEEEEKYIKLTYANDAQRRYGALNASRRSSRKILIFFRSFIYIFSSSTYTI